MISKIVGKYKIEHILLLICIGILFVFNLYNIGKMYGPVVMPDEVGYWSTGAYLAGYDWSGVVNKSPYYGWGYGSIILTPLFLFFKSPVMLYRAAIVINTVILCFNFLVLRKIAVTLQITSNGVINTLASFTVAAYSSYTFFSKTAYAESLLVLMFDILVMFVLYSEKNTKNVVAIFMAIVGAWMFVIHQRAIGVICVLCALVCWRKLTKRLDTKGFIIFFLFLFLTLYLCMEIKSDIVAGIWINENNGSGNDFSGQTGKIDYLLSIEGMTAFLFNVLGRIVYLGNATFLLFYIGMGKMVKELHYCLKSRWIRQEEKWIRHEDFNFFLFFSILAAIAISALFMIFPTRFEHIIYGRYSEYVIAPFLLYTILSIDFSTIWKQLKYVVMIHIILSAFVYLYSNQLEFNSIGVFNTVGVRWLNGLNNMSDMVKYLLWAMQIIFIISFILYYFGRRKKGVFIILLSCMWFYASNQVCKNDIYVEQERNKDLYLFTQSIEQIVEDETVYYLLEDEDRNTPAYWTMFRMKFFLYSSEMKAVTYEELKQQKEGYVLIYKKYEKAVSEFVDSNTFIMKNDTFMMEKINIETNGVDL